MEPHATVAAWNGDRLTLWSKSQFVVNEQAEIAADLRHSRRECAGDLPLYRRRLRNQPEDLAACHARGAGGAAGRDARSSSCYPGKQMFFTTGHRPRTTQRVALGATPDGRLTSLIHEGTGETSRHEQFIEALTSSFELHVCLPECAHALSAAAA